MIGFCVNRVSLYTLCCDYTPDITIDVLAQEVQCFLWCTEYMYY